MAGSCGTIVPFLCELECSNSLDLDMDTKSPRFTAALGGLLGAVFAIVLSMLVSALGLVSGYLAYGIGFLVFFCILVLVLRRVSKNVIAKRT